MISRRVLAVLGPLLVLGLTGCARDVVVDEQELEEKVSEQFENSVGHPPEGLDCPGDLTAEPGVEVTCTMTGGRGGDREVTVVITEVDGADVGFTLELDEEQAG